MLGKQMENAEKLCQKLHQTGIICTLKGNTKKLRAEGLGLDS